MYDISEQDSDTVSMALSCRIVFAESRVTCNWLELNNTRRIFTLHDYIHVFHAQSGTNKLLL